MANSESREKPREVSTTASPKSPISTRDVGLIGAIGGVSLTLLKLIENGFFLDNLTGTLAIASYLTYIAYVFLGIVVAIFFVEKDASNEKIKKNAFVLGLLAPSLLLAITTNNAASQPRENPAQKVPDLPASIIGEFILPNAWASATCSAGMVSIVTEDGALCVEGNSIKKAQLEPSYAEAFKQALGRGRAASKYSFVVGRTTDVTVARKLTADINSMVLTSSELKAMISVPEGNGMLFVTIGSPDEKQTAEHIKDVVTKQAIKTVHETRAMQETVDVANLLVNGIVVETKLLFDDALDER